MKRSRHDSEHVVASLYQLYDHNYVRLKHDLVEFHEKRKRRKHLPPLIITSHNVNGFFGLLRDHLEEFKQFFLTHKPDVHCISEVQLQCAGVGSSEGPRQGSLFDGIDETGKENPKKRRQYLAVEKLKNTAPFNLYRFEFSLNSSAATSGTLVMLKKEIEIPMLRFQLNENEDGHEQEGRIIVVEFMDFILLNTYAPNNQVKESGWERRRAWDKKIHNFFLRQHQDEHAKPVVWVGDLNSTTDDHDMDSPRFYRHDVLNVRPTWAQGIYNNKKTRELLTNGVNLDAPKESLTPWLDCHGDKGQPGTTMNEQKRFQKIRTDGGLVDAYRLLNPVIEGGMHTTVTKGREAWTWRGMPGRNGESQKGRYFGRGMRIDYTLVSQSLVDRVERAEILGFGEYQENFIGSDHCPILLELRER